MRKHLFLGYIISARKILYRVISSYLFQHHPKGIPGKVIVFDIGKK